MCIYPWCLKTSPHGHFPVYRPYAERLAPLMSKRYAWGDFIREVAPLWVEAAEPWQRSRTVRPFTNRRSNVSGVVLVAKGIEEQLDEMISRLSSETRVFLLNRIVAQIVEDTRVASLDQAVRWTRDTIKNLV